MNKLMENTPVILIIVGVLLLSLSLGSAYKSSSDTKAALERLATECIQAGNEAIIIETQFICIKK